MTTDDSDKEHVTRPSAQTNITVMQESEAKEDFSKQVGISVVLLAGAALVIFLAFLI